MLAISRQNLIKELLQENKSVTIADLAVRMNVTRETIRRDLRAMEQEHELIRTHGGAYILIQLPAVELPEYTLCSKQPVPELTKEVP